MKMNDNTAKVMATVVIWTALACIFIFGIFSSGWRPLMNFPYLLMGAIFLLCAAAFGATVAVWRYK